MKSEQKQMVVGSVGRANFSVAEYLAPRIEILCPRLCVGNAGLDSCVFDFFS